MQSQLFLGIPAERSAKNDANELVNALEYIHGKSRAPAHVSRSVLQMVIGEDWSDRRFRDAANASNGRVLSAPGVQGYRLARHTSVDSYYSTERARYKSQIDAMTKRLTEMDRAVHCSSGQGGDQISRER